MKDIIKHASKLAIRMAKEFEGATAPNPTVGAVGLTEDGFVLSVEAHQKAGQPHAEINLIKSLHDKNCLNKLHTLFITLEPCCHKGRTPPCTSEILKTPVKHIIMGAADPNPRVSGKGAAQLRDKINTSWLEEFDPNLANECNELIRPYSHWIKTKRPWIVLKQAFNEEGSMIPSPGQKTFTSQSSLRLSHELRKQSDAILTASGTVLADNPLFTVRNIVDHPHKHRWLALFDRRDRIPRLWKYYAMHNGFNIMECSDVERTLQFLGNEGVHSGLIEAGPTFSEYILENGLWNERIEIFKGAEGEEDSINRSFNH